MKVGCEKCGNTPGWIPGALGFSWQCECAIPAQVEANFKELVPKVEPDPPTIAGYTVSGRTDPVGWDADGLALYPGDRVVYVGPVPGVNPSAGRGFEVAGAGPLPGTVGLTKGTHINSRVCKKMMPLARDIDGNALYAGDMVELADYPLVSFRYEVIALLDGYTEPHLSLRRNDESQPNGRFCEARGLRKVKS